MVVSKKLLVWLSLVSAAAIAATIHGHYADHWDWRGLLNPDHPGFWALWVILQSICAVLLLPSMALVVFAAISFPDRPAQVLLMSLIGVGLSASLIYRNVQWIALSALLQRNPIAAKASTIVRKHGAIGLALWCAAPMLPSDLGCYLAAGSGMRFGRYLLAVLAGEAVLCASIVFGIGALAGQ